MDRFQRGGPAPDFIITHLLDSRLALTLVTATFILPFCVVICRQTFYDLPIELEEAAMVDGASHFDAFVRVALPLAMPAIAAAALIMFAFAWNEYLFAVILTIKDAATMPVHIAGGVDTRGVQFWFLAVRSLIAMVPSVLLALPAQRYACAARRPAQSRADLPDGIAALQAHARPGCHSALCACLGHHPPAAVIVFEPMCKPACSSRSLTGSQRSAQQVP